MSTLFGNKCLAYSFYIFTITAFVTFSEAKPTNSGNVNAGESGASPFSPRLLVREVHPSPRIVISEPHPVQRSEHSQARAAEGVWQGSARLPSSAKSGGNEHSRYNIRRDGSLSIALQGSSSSSSNTANKPIEQSNPKFPNPLPSYIQSHFNNGWNRKDRKITPTELRSFSVVLSDVDVIGTYGQTRSDQQQHPDSYSQAGVTSYRLNSNSIHRMNASWKLNPNKTQVDSDQLLHFLSLFSSDAAKKQEQPSHDEDEDDLEEEESRRQQKKATRHEDTQPNGDNDRDDQLNYSSNSSSDINSLPFSTWSETSRQLLADRNHNETIPSNHSGTATTGGSWNNNSSISNSNGKSQSQVVLHDLILTLGKLMETKNPENNTSSSATDKKATRRGTASTTDPQQTAADLKKLMSLLLRSDEPSGELSSAKDGAQVVNIVITPGSNSSDDKQKILFLKSHQIEQLLQGAMTDPNLKHVVSKIASALRTPQSVHKRNSNSNFYDNLYDSAPSPAACSSCIPQEDVEDLLSPNQGPMTGLNPHLTTSSTPDGFPLTGNGFLNLNHPNLQFHQALHHLVANGSAPTTINATTKTNVINIFVLNFNSASTPSVANITKVMTEGKPIVEAGDEEENDDYVLPLRPPVVYSLNNYKPGGIITKHDLVQSPSPRPTLQSQALFFNKMGMPGQIDEEDTEESLEADMDRVINSQSRPQRFKPFIEVTSSHGNPYVAITPATTTTTSTDRINILNLLPNHANSFTPVQKFGEGTRVRPSEYSNPIHHNDPESLDQEAAELFSYLMKAEKETFQGASSTPAASTTPTTTTTEEPSSLLPPEFAHLSWILKQEPPPKPNVGPSTVSASHAPKNKLGNKNPTQFYDEEYDSDENDSGESEPSFLQPPNFNFNKRFGISHKPSQLLSSSSPPTIDPRPLYEQILSSSVLNFTVPPSTTKNPSETKSKGAPTPVTTTTFKPRPNSNKRRPIQLFSPGDKENTKQRVRKLMTALGYSALPTLAAGAVATWPYWVPIVATGRRKRRSHSLIQSKPNTWTPTSTSLAPKSDKRPAVTKELVEDQLFPQLPKEPIESKVGAEPKMESGPRGRGIEAETEALGRREGAGAPADSSREKWIRVEVITESSSPTLRTAENRKSTLGSVMTDNNRQFLNGEPQDVPLLKNFLKNVLSNEWNISTTTAPLTTSTTQQEPNSHSTPTPTPVLSSAGQIRPRPSGSSGTRTPSYAAFAQDEDSDAQRPNNSPTPFYASQSLINPSKSKPFLLPASEHAVKSPIMLPSRNNSQQRPNQAQRPVIGSINDDLERQRRQRLRHRLAANIREAETAYASAAVLPLWFPILLGNGLKKFTDTDKLESYSQFQ